MPKIQRTGNSSGGRVGKPVGVARPKPHGPCNDPKACCGKG